MTWQPRPTSPESSSVPVVITRLSDSGAYFFLSLLCASALHSLCICSAACLTPLPYIHYERRRVWQPLATPIFAAPPGAATATERILRHSKTTSGVSPRRPLPVLRPIALRQVFRQVLRKVQEKHQSIAYSLNLHLCRLVTKLLHRRSPPSPDHDRKRNRHDRSPNPADRPEPKMQ